MKALVNGLEATAVSLLERGLQYGDGVFETLAYRDGHLLLWQRHYQRLREGCERLGIVAPDADILLQDIATLTDADQNAVVKVIVTRGESERGYNPQQATTPSRIVMRLPDSSHPEHYAREGVSVRICQLRLAAQPRLAGIKHLNRLEQILARAEWTDSSFAEGLLLDAHDHVIEGIATNLFGVWNGQWVTPSLESCGVAGTLRGAIMDYLATQGITCSTRAIHRDELWQASELFLCNSVVGIWPVRCLEQQEYPLGAQTRWLQSRLDDVFQYG